MVSRCKRYLLRLPTTCILHPAPIDPYFVCPYLLHPHLSRDNIIVPISCISYGILLSTTSSKLLNHLRLFFDQSTQLLPLS